MNYDEVKRKLDIESEKMAASLKTTDLGKLIKIKLNELYTSIADEIETEVNSQGASKSKSLAIVKDLSGNINKTNTQLSKTVLKNHNVLFPAGEERAFSNAKKVLEILNGRGIS